MKTLLGTKASSLALTAIILGFSCCSVPNLEKPECEAARTAVRQFYSFHFGNDMTPSAEYLKLRAKYLSPELFGYLSSRGPVQVDYFTATDDYPKAFRVGECELISDQIVRFQILVFWRTDTRSEEREIWVESEKSENNWLISKVDNKK